MRGKKQPRKITMSYSNIYPNHIALQAVKERVYYAEAGALVPMFEKFAFDHKPNLLKWKSILNKPIFLNVRTLNATIQLP